MKKNKISLITLVFLLLFVKNQIIYGFSGEVEFLNKQIEIKNDQEFYISQIKNKINNFNFYTQNKNNFINLIKSDIDNLDLNNKLTLKLIKDLLNDLKNKSNKEKIIKVYTNNEQEFDLIIQNPDFYKKKYGENYNNLLRRKVINELELIGYKDWNNKTLFDISYIDANGNIVFGNDVKIKDDSLENFIKNNYFEPQKNILNNNIFEDQKKEEILNNILKYLYNFDVIKNVQNAKFIKNINYINGNFEVKYLIDVGKFEITTLRERVNNDAYYRYNNIKTAFRILGNNKLLIPGKVISFNNSIDYDPNKKINYMNGASINNGKEVKSYGGGLCGAATAIYQGIILNKGIDIISAKNHSWWYGVLYNAKINGNYIKTPGLDATIWMNSLDLKFKNKTDTPIIFGAKMLTQNGKKIEQIYTISKIGNKGYLKFLKKNKKCYYWDINGTTKISCYKLIK